MSSIPSHVCKPVPVVHNWQRMPTEPGLHVTFLGNNAMYVEEVFQGENERMFTFVQGKLHPIVSEAHRWWCKIDVPPRPNNEDACTGHAGD